MTISIDNADHETVCVHDHGGRDDGPQFLLAHATVFH